MFLSHSIPEDAEEDEGGVALLRKSEEVRTILTALLDCGDQLCREIVHLIRKKNTNVVTHIADIVRLLLILIIPLFMYS